MTQLHRSSGSGMTRLAATIAWPTDRHAASSPTPRKQLPIVVAHAPCPPPTMSLPTIVEAWLSEVHDPLQHPPAASPSWHPAASRRLRPRPRRFNNPHIRCKRRLVMPEDASTPPPPPRRSQRVRSRSTTAPDNTLFDDTTPDNTPRPLRTHTVPLFDGPLLPPSAYSDALSQPPPSPTPRRKRSVQSSASGSTTKRSASPVKGMAAVIDAGVKYTDLADMSPDEMQTLLGKEIAELYETFMLFQDLDGVVPAVIRVCFFLHPLRISLTSRSRDSRPCSTAGACPSDTSPPTSAPHWHWSWSSSRSSVSTVGAANTTAPDQPTKRPGTTRSTAGYLTWRCTATPAA